MLAPRFNLVARSLLVGLTVLATGLSSRTTAEDLAGAPATHRKTRDEIETVPFPGELVNWRPHSANPVFTAKRAGDWAVRIRERGWILREGDCFHLWFTGYDGTRDGIKRLGYATSRDGMHWTPSQKNPLSGQHWVEDMMVVNCRGTYYMFAEGDDDNHAVMLTSTDRVRWEWQGRLDVRLADGKRRPEEPCGTPTAWRHEGQWYLFYERLDRGVWLAKTNDLDSKIWINVQDSPVLRPGPLDYDKHMIALDQVIAYRGAYFAFYHGTSDGRAWNTNIARSTDLVHWEKYAGNPIVGGNKSSGIVVAIDGDLRLYTMHDRIDVFEARK
jgi:hypothetical protein